MLGKVTLLGSIYIKESSVALRECFNSLARCVRGLDISTVLVEDGPITVEASDVIEEFRSVLAITSVRFEVNLGLGAALNAGLDVCKTDLIARFDTDDIYPEDRLKLQIGEFEKRPCLAVLGGSIDEFMDDPSDVCGRRVLPTGSGLVAAYAKQRCPLNHMTVMFRKHAVIAAGGYGSESLFEDYGLWVRMLQRGFEIDNLPLILAHARVGNGMYGRRGGWKYAVNELRLFRGFAESGFISWGQFVKNAVVRVPIRLLPATLRGQIYKLALRERIGL